MVQSRDERQRQSVSKFRTSFSRQRDQAHGPSNPGGDGSNGLFQIKGLMPFTGCLGRILLIPEEKTFTEQLLQ